MKKTELLAKKRRTRFLKDLLKNNGSIDKSFFLVENKNGSFNMWVSSMEDADSMFNTVQKAIAENKINLI